MEIVMKGVSKMLWVLAGIGTVAGAAFLVMGLLAAKGAPQEAAAAATAAAAAVLPYVLARSWDELTRG